MCYNENENTEGVLLRNGLRIFPGRITGDSSVRFFSRTKEYIMKGEVFT